MPNTKAGYFAFGLEISAKNEIDLSILRSKIGYLSQFPTMFTGNIRINIDPENIFTDEEIIKALHFLKLIDCLRSNLQTTMSEHGGGGSTLTGYDSIRIFTQSKLMSLTKLDSSRRRNASQAVLEKLDLQKMSLNSLNGIIEEEMETISEVKRKKYRVQSSILSNNSASMRGSNGELPSENSPNGLRRNSRSMTQLQEEIG
jgi:hypothetical protein